MRRKFYLLCALCAPHYGFSAPLTLAQFQKTMAAHIATLAKTTTASVHVEVLGTTQNLFGHNAETRLVPASASKIITTSAALEAMGASFAFQTTAVLQGPDLYLIGSGDPYFQSENLWQMAQDVAATGLTHISSVKINNSAFQNDYWGLHNFPGSLDDPSAGIVSATNLNYNSVQFNVTPSNGAAPTIDVGPRHNAYAIVSNRVTQISGTTSDLAAHSLGMIGNKESFEVTGTIGKKSKMVSVYSPALNPASHAAYALAGLLRDLKMTVDTDFGGASFAPMSPGGRILATHHSYPLNFLANIYMPASINYMAEEVFEVLGSAMLGGAASLSKSQAAARQFLSKRSSCVNAAMENGSGLTFNNFISAHCMVETFQSLNRKGLVYTDLINSLPVGGKTGTLKSRFKHNSAGFVASRVHAKTGTLWSAKVVTALVGLTTISSGQTVLFAFLENDSRTDEKLLTNLKIWEDKGVEYIQNLKL